MRRYRGAPAVLAVASLLALAGAGVSRGEAPKLTYNGILEVSSGSYTLSETTRSFLLFTGLSYESGRWTLSASLPLIYQDSPFVSYAGGVPVPSGRRRGVEGDDPVSGGGSGGSGGSGGGGPGRGSGGTVEVPNPDTLDFSEAGVGDPVFRADFIVNQWAATGSSFGLYGAVKPAIADEDNGFGTGEWDYGAGITLSKKVGSALLLADVGYWIFGDLPDFDLEDPLAYSLALGRSLKGGRVSVLGAVSGLTETVDGIDGPLQISFTGSRILRRDRRISLTLAAGLTDTAPDVSLAAGWSVEL